MFANAEVGRKLLTGLMGLHSTNTHSRALKLLCLQQDDPFGLKFPEVSVFILYYHIFGGSVIFEIVNQQIFEKTALMIFKRFFYGIKSLFVKL